MLDVKESIPGLRAAKTVQDRIRAMGIQDIELFFDHQIKMWAVCQVNKRSTVFSMESAAAAEPLILWWVKNTADATYREPSEQDVSDAVAIAQRAQKTWDKGGDWLADQLDAQDKKRDEAHKKKQQEMIKDITPQLKKFVRKELG